MIAIIGKYGVGKTTFLKKVESFGYKILYTDEFFANCYKFNNSCYWAIKNELGQNYVNESEVIKNELRNFILKDKNNINILEKIVYPILEKHLEENRYDFVEIPNIFSKNANFERFFSHIFNIKTSEKKRQENIEKKGVLKKNSNLNNSLNVGKIKKKVVDILWEDIEKEDFFINFFKSLN
ncbi:dephospho-CoA kinase [Mesomycoplasma lagogenitalium]|uniref:Dephospho-CoA kinase n=1 Tax=Mesomycoplasma lagogenitalium TaxID=171286 RepID=A0ABY8LV93_9BACT|nr:dephospho-CoA kinase [Mesomycoplasma lagogenitalium]WGI36448.1 dephospho-CoA kinase [Mesomycoplasma lagogenitalium]